MFERYTEKARRTIFFARYEASQFGSDHIQSHHLLLGLLRENKALFQHLSAGTNYESIEKELVAETKIQKSISTSVDLPLSEESKRVLKHAADEADWLRHRHIGTEHLLLGLLRENKSLAAKVLNKYGAEFSTVRKKIEQSPEEHPTLRYATVAGGIRPTTADTIEIHGSRFNPEYIHDAVKRCRQYNWHWHKEPWAARDIVMDRSHGTVSLAVSYVQSLRLAEDAANFELVKAGWKQDHCVICRWLFSESKDDPSHAEGYTNGREWLCTECYEKFWSRPDFFSSPYSDIT